MKTILVIEDEPGLQEIIQDLLEIEGFRTIVADNGSMGIQLAEQHLPDLILCDVIMPDINGYEVLKTLQQNLVTATIPFLFLTAIDNKADQRHGMELGADDYLSKTCGKEELLRAIASRLEKRTALQSQLQQQLDNLRSSIALSLPHELRTPMTGILGGAKLLRMVAKSAASDQIMTIADTIENSAERLYKLVEKFLLYTKLEITARDPEKLKALQKGETANPQFTITDVAQSIAQETQREADLILHIQEVTIAFPEPELRKVMKELIDNAFKFSPVGTPVQILSTVDATYWTVAAINQGRGMTVEQIANLGAYIQFDRKFYEQKGTGLGLAIAQLMLELYGGKLVIESIPGQKSIVKAIFPRSYAHDSEP